MVFSSNIFLFLFLPLFLAAYYLSPARWRSWTAVIGSYCFYAWWRVDFLLLFALVTVWNYAIGAAIFRCGARTRAARHWLVLGVASDLAVLAYFKYANFGIDSLNVLLGASGLAPLEWGKVLLPIGISFYIFESISYIADVYRGDTRPARSFVDFACFVSLFPHLIAGPVFRYKDLADQFVARTHSIDKFVEGSMRFMQGFVKKVFIADSIAPMVAAGFALENPTTADAWLMVLAYTAQLYFDFSGYSDMAIGLGLMMGFRFVENFNQPYISQSITEFWRRWHMSLSAWLRDYLYVALGGNRGGTAKTYRNLFLTMLLGGFWHGANWTFLLWGAWHGALLALERALGLGTGAARTPATANVIGHPRLAGPGMGETAAPPALAPTVFSFQPQRWLLTLLLVMLGWVMFRAADVGSALRIYQAMFSFDGAGLSELYAGGITRLQLATLALAWIITLGAGLAQHYPLPRLDLAWARHSTAAWLLLPLFALSVLKLSAQSYSPFLYFQF